MGAWQKGSYPERTAGLTARQGIKKKTVEKLDETNYADLAEQAILALKGKVDKWGKSIPMLTTSKIRNLLAMISDIYNDVINSSEAVLSSETIERINYLKIRIVYEAGRDARVKDLVEEAAVLEHLKEINNDKKQFIRFCRYMEALVAYHRFHGGKDH